MPYDVLIDSIIKEGEERKEQILAEAREKADAMLTDLEKRIDDLRKKEMEEIERGLAEYRTKELNRAHHRGEAFKSIAKGEIIDEVYRKVQHTFHSIIDGPLYPPILQKLLIEGLQEMRGKVYVVASSSDCSLIKDLLKGRSINNCEIISITPDDRIKGGIEILSHDKSISVINTLSSRFEKIKEDLMPEIEKILFHGNQS